MSRIPVALLAMAALFLGCGDPSGPSGSGLEIVYSIQVPGVYAHDLFLIHDDGTENTPFTPKAGDKISPSWSPDGRTLAFTLDRTDVSLWLADADGSNARSLPMSAFGELRWSPDGTWLILVTDIGVGRFVIEAVHPDGSGRYTLYSAIGDIRPSPPSWSRGGRIAFVRGANVVGAARNIWAVKSDGSGLVQLTTGFRDERPVWSPDGGTLAFSSIGTGIASEIVVVNADGTGRRVIASGGTSMIFIMEAWSPDGRWVLFRGTRTEFPTYCAYYKVAVGGGEPRRVTPDLDGVECAGASWR